ncbi:MAG: hypothetical protein RBU30_07990 [Polyangia bacterium]|jgi:hypothetical protein|nr:hypothetical protein [Polyangia bacterium]
MVGAGECDKSIEGAFHRSHWGGALRWFLSVTMLVLFASGCRSGSGDENQTQDPDPACATGDGSIIALSIASPLIDLTRCNYYTPDHVAIEGAATITAVVRDVFGGTTIRLAMVSPSVDATILALLPAAAALPVNVGDEVEASLRYDCIPMHGRDYGASLSTPGGETLLLAIYEGMMRGEVPVPPLCASARHSCAKVGYLARRREHPAFATDPRAPVVFLRPFELAELSYNGTRYFVQQGTAFVEVEHEPNCHGDLGAFESWVMVLVEGGGP